MGCFRMSIYFFIWLVLVLGMTATLDRNSRISINSFNHSYRKIQDEWKEKYYEVAKRIEQILTEIHNATHAIQMHRNKTLFCAESMSKLQKENEELNKKFEKLIKKLGDKDHKCVKSKGKSKRD